MLTIGRWRKKDENFNLEHDLSYVVNIDKHIHTNIKQNLMVTRTSSNFL